MDLLVANTREGGGLLGRVYKNRYWADDSTAKGEGYSNSFLR